MSREYTTRVFDALTGTELHADVTHGPHGQLVTFGAHHLTASQAASAAQQMLHLANVIRDNQAQGRPA